MKGDFARRPGRAMRWTMAFVVGLALAALWEPPARAAETWRMRTWTPSFDFASPSTVIDYAPLAQASRSWRICASYPHLKDSYWISVNHGMVEQARQLGVALEVVEAGGYPNLAHQRAQIEACVARGADALIVGTVSYRGLSDTIRRIARDIPVVAAVNDIAKDGISAMTGVPWVTMGARPGEFLAARHPAGTEPVKVAWFPGPEGAGWVAFVEQGFRDAIADSAVEIVATKYGDTGKEIQLLLIEEALSERPDIDYIVGSAVTAEAAVSLLRTRGLSDDIGILADYFTHAVYRGIKRDKILAAPTDFPVLQGRLAIDQAVRLLEGRLVHAHVGPVIKLVTEANVDLVGPSGSLAPNRFTPTFTVDPGAR